MILEDISLIQSKEIAEISIVSISSSFQILMSDNIEYLQVLVVRRTSCQLKINSPVMAFLYIYKLKINAKLQEKTLVRWDMSIHHLPTVSWVDLWSQNFLFNVVINWHDQFKATKEVESAYVLKQSKLINSGAVMKIQVIWDFFKKADYILIMTFSLVWWCC